MKITAQMQGLRELRDATAKLAKRARYATAQGINDAAKEFQAAQIAHQRGVFTVRRPGFVDKAVKIKPFARAESLTATVLIDPPGGQARADILTKFEMGGTKTPQGQSLAIPEGIRRTRTGVLPKSLRPKALDLEVHGASGGKVLKGKKRVILIRTGPGKGVILQRTGRGKRGGLQVLFGLAPKAKIPKRLSFEENAMKVLPKALEKNIGARIREAIDYARGG